MFGGGLRVICIDLRLAFRLIFGKGKKRLMTFTRLKNKKSFHSQRVDDAEHNCTKRSRFCLN